eukprot:4147357-Amphidinium_carterae.1
MSQAALRMQTCFNNMSKQDSSKLHEVVANTSHFKAAPNTTRCWPQCSTFSLRRSGSMDELQPYLQACRRSKKAVKEQ